MAILSLQPPPSPSTSKLPLSPTQSQATAKTNIESGKATPIPTPRRAIGLSASFDVSSNDDQAQSGKRVIAQPADDEHDEGEEQVDQQRVGVNRGDGMIQSDDAVEEDGEEESLPVLHIEVRLLPTSTIRTDLIKRMFHTHLNEEYETLLTNSEIKDWQEVTILLANVSRVWVAECNLPTLAVPLSHVSLQIHVYQPPKASNPMSFTLAALAGSHSASFHSNDDQEDEDADVSAATVLQLPAMSLEGLWDNLVYDGDVKSRLLGYIHSTLLFGDSGVDFNVVAWNRVVLLHGPPGTGKTSLCRALAQKLAIRLSERYDRGKLVEINSHSLFSKWFSESGKLVQKLFGAVMEMVDDKDGFVVVLIDEVESLTAARAGAMEGKEPSDALRVVNALLTQLDKLKHRKNCLVVTTSNLSAAIDGAFIDRADIKQYIGLPPPQAVYWILQSCLTEMVRAGLIAPLILLDWPSIQGFRSTGLAPNDRTRQCSSILYDLAHSCQSNGMSGRTLRRLPVLAHARYISASGSASSKPSMETWLRAMGKCVEDEGAELEKVGISKGI